MTPKELLIIQDRLQTCLDSIRFQNSGCDVHTLGNIRHTAQMLLEQLEEDPQCMEDDLVLQITKNVEIATAEYFKKKYSYLWKHGKI